MSGQLKIGIMQPYFLPYIGYFALIAAVDKFVLIDDVQYIRKGWVNRNRIKVSGNWQYITMPVKKAPRSTPIRQIETFKPERYVEVLRRTIEANYGRCPHFDEIKDLLFPVFTSSTNISKLDIALINKVCEYLKISTPIYISSELKDDVSLRGIHRIHSICRILRCSNYVNSIGGVDLYSKRDFSELGLTLNFLKLHGIRYMQGKYEFVPDLSILDVLMWNSSNAVRKMIEDYELI